MPSLDELRSPSHAKLTPEALAELARARTYFTDRVYEARDAVESALVAAGHRDASRRWGVALESALQPNALITWLVSLAVPPPIKRRSTDHPGIDHQRNRWRARCWTKGKVIFNRSFDTLDEAIEARAEFLRDNP